MLLKIDDPVVAHEYWKAGLLCMENGKLWAEWERYRLVAAYDTPYRERFLASMCDAFINIEE